MQKGRNLKRGRLKGRVGVQEAEIGVQESYHVKENYAFRLKDEPALAFTP